MALKVSHHRSHRREGLSAPLASISNDLCLQSVPHTKAFQHFFFQKHLPLFLIEVIAKP